LHYVAALNELDIIEEDIKSAMRTLASSKPAE